MAKSRADKLKGMSMPKKPASQQEADLDLAMLGNPDMDPEMAEGEAEGMELGMELGAEMPLDSLSDDELLSELKKRGLMSKSSPVGKAAESDLMGEEGEEEGSIEEELEESPEQQEMEDEMGAEMHPKAAAAAKKKLKKK